MDEAFPGTRQGGNQGLGCAAMITAGRIDHSFGGLGFGLQQPRVIKRANDRFDAVSGNGVGLCLVTNEAANPMAACDKGRRNCAADKAIRTGYEDSHFGSRRVSFDFE
jgi:hypothetical protein